MNFKPLLADDCDLTKLKYPVIVSPKLDGVRATFVNGRLLTRSLKPLGNPRVSSYKSSIPLDGELIVGEPNSKTVFRDTMKIVSSHTADIKYLRFHVFDMVDTETNFVDRLKIAHASINGTSSFCVPVPHILVPDQDHLLQYEENCLNAGFEGAMIRDPLGRYKFGRSTANEGILLKLKRYHTSEARVTALVEQMHNANEAKIDNLGNTERSSHQANMIPMGVLGAVTVKDVKSGVEFNVGTGFTAEERAKIWRHRANYLGKLLTYKFLPVGVKDKPRHPAFIGWRMEEDQ